MLTVIYNPYLYSINSRLFHLENIKSVLFVSIVHSVTQGNAFPALEVCMCGLLFIRQLRPSRLEGWPTRSNVYSYNCLVQRLIFITEFMCVFMCVYTCVCVHVCTHNSMRTESVSLLPVTCQAFNHWLNEWTHMIFKECLKPSVRNCQTELGG